MLKFISRLWKQYRYRFVPWIAVNLKDRAMRQVTRDQGDQILPSAVVHAALIKFFTALHQSGHGRMQFYHQRQGSIKENVIVEEKNNWPCSSDKGGKVHIPVDSPMPHNTQPTLSHTYTAMSLLGRKLFRYISAVPSSQHIGKTRDVLYCSMCPSDISVSPSYHKDMSAPSSEMKESVWQNTVLSSSLHVKSKCHHDIKSSNSYKVSNICPNTSYSQEAMDRTERTCAMKNNSTVYLNELQKGKQDMSEDMTQDAMWKKSLEQQSGCPKISKRGLDTMFNRLGFCIQRCSSTVPGAGTGVCVTRGTIPKHTLVAIYPGAIYLPSEPIFFQSLHNPFIFRCIDRVLIDGKDKGLSGYLYKSCCHRDRVGATFTSDMSWLSPHPANPMAIGQYINNQGPGYPANVAYQEFEVPLNFPFHLRQYFPNNFCSASLQEVDTKRLLRTVVLVSLREIAEGEELFSSYFTVVY